MKKLPYFLLTTALIVTPALARAQDVPGASPSTVPPTATNATVQVTTPPKPPVGIRPQLQQIGSTTKALIQTARGELKTMILDRAAAFKAMMGSSTPEERMKMREDSKMAIQEKRAEVASTTQAAKLAAQAKFSQGVQTSVEAITTHLTRAIEQLTAIADRIDARITELQNAGRDMTSSAALLVTARADIATAQTKVAAVGTALAAALTSTTPKEKFGTVKTTVQTAEEALRTAKGSLQQALVSVKAEGAASTTVQN